MRVPMPCSRVVWTERTNPYDELAYRCLPIEWTAPERLALASTLHGGPRLDTDACRVLELGCGDGANLLPMAHHRNRASFVGVDGAASQIALANERRALLNLKNARFIHADFRQAEHLLDGEFDVIIGHGIFSWVPDDARDVLLSLCRKALRPGGLLYLNYNTYPGWSLRGMVREFLLAQTAHGGDLRERALQAQQVAKQIAGSFGSAGQADASPYSRLLANEFLFVGEHDLSYVAHEFLSEINRAYWRSDFLALLRSHGFEFVADADFNYSSGRLPVHFALQLKNFDWVGRAVEDTADLLCNRQLHSPILTRGAHPSRPLGTCEFAEFSLASCLVPLPVREDRALWFQHPPTGYEVETRKTAMAVALSRLHPRWPRGLRVADLFNDVAAVMEDLLLLHRNGLLELRLAEPADPVADSRPLARLEAQLGGYATTRYHTRIAAA